jgi:transcription initiation factor TFIID subunit 6
MSVWNPDNIKDVAESVGISSLSEEVLQGLSLDIEYRLAQVLEEALKFMRHSKRTTLWTQDIAQALRTLDVEPLYGYESTRPLRFGEASIGPGQPLFYVEDEEMDLEKLINAPLPKVPREMSLTGKLVMVILRIFAKSLYSALASCRRRPAFNPPKPYNSRLPEPRACS